MLDSMSGQVTPGSPRLARRPAAPDVRPGRGSPFRALAAGRPIGILIDDLQWSDEDNLRLLRYVIRADGVSPIFVVFAIRPEEFAVVTKR